MTPLDAAHETMTQNPDQDILRVRYYERLATVELFMLLKSEPLNDNIDPMIFPAGGQDYVLVFDTEARLADFTGKTAPFVAMSGRAIVSMLKQSPVVLGLAVNLGDAPSSILIPPEGINWMAQILNNRSTEMQTQIRSLHAPFDLPDDLLVAIEGRLATATGLLERAFLVGVQYQDGTNGNLLALIDVIEAAQPALRQAFSEVLGFSSCQSVLDVAFFDPKDAHIAQIEKTGLRLKVAKPQPGDRAAAITSPGMDPDNPPILR